MITNFILFCLVKKSKIYIPSIINTQKKLLSRAIWACFWQTSSNLEDYNYLDFTILNCTSQFKIHLHPNNLKGKEKRSWFIILQQLQVNCQCLSYMGCITLQKALFIFEAGSPHSCKLTSE